MVCQKEIIIKKANKEDKKDVFYWRNSEVVREGSFDNSLITWEVHDKWFDTQVDNMYIACCSDNKLGVIRFNEKEKGVFISVNLNPEYIGMGYGNLVIDKATALYKQGKKNMKSVLAEIKTSNIRSKKAFLKAGYLIIEEEKDKIIMEKR
jgi:RimJ/RimL family protein N-acetyltransferase